MPAHISQNGASRMLDLVPLGRPRLPAALLGLLVVLGLVVAGSPAARAAGTGVHAVAAQPDACPPVTFARTQLDASAGRVVGVAAADVNGDGAPDLQALVSAEGFGINALYDFRADGLGDFSAPTVYDYIRPDPLTIEAGDFNADGFDDVATTHILPDAVSGWLGARQGGLGRVDSFVRSAFDLSTGHFDADDTLDLAAVQRGSSVSVLAGDRRGGFGRSGEFPVGGPSTEPVLGSGAYAVATGDFNGDGRDDIATANFWSRDVSVLLQTATGFAPAVNRGVAGQPQAVATGDFNEDGRLDLATASFQDRVSVLLGDGSGGFVRLPDLAVGGNAQAMTSGDFNRDGRVDLAVASQSASNVSLLLGDGTGEFAPPASYLVGNGPRSITSADFNGDGLLDLATGNFDNGTVSVLLNTSRAENAVPSAGGDAYDVKAGGTLSVSAVTQPRYGSVAIIDGGAAVSYTPVADHVGPDPFTYTATDADGDTATARVSLTVAPARGCVTAGFGAPRSFSVARLTDSTQ